MRSLNIIQLFSGEGGDGAELWAHVKEALQINETKRTGIPGKHFFAKLT